MILNNQYCPDCFKLIQNKSRGPYCGFNRFVRVNSMALDDNTLLAKRYILGKVLGSGGFGITYKAYDIEADRVCAIKEYFPLGMVSRDMSSGHLILNSKSMEDEFSHRKKRFLEEVHVLQSLDYHPIVTNIFDYFSENSTCYFVMEFVDGVTLRHLVDESGGSIPYKQLWNIMEQIMEGLHQVHMESNIFHRDISPDNILVKTNGEVRLIDFGNAKYISLDDQSLSIVLKQGYAPLEQYYNSSDQGAYTDVYSLACTFYHCLTGVKTPSALSRAAKDTMKPLSFYMGQKYQDLSDIIEQAAMLKSERRTQTVQILLNQIREFNRLQGFAETDGDSNKLKKAYLDGISGAVKGYRYEIPANTPITVGRSKECQIQIDRPTTISRKHFDIFYDSENNIFYLENYSKNGTSIDEQECEIGNYYSLEEGACITLSKNACVFRLGVLYG